MRQHLDALAPVMQKLRMHEYAILRHSMIAMLQI